MRSRVVAALLTLVSAGPLVPATASAAELSVTVENVVSGSGAVLVAACTRETFLGAACPWRAAAQARQGAVTVLLRNVPPGRYALQVFHDENGNGDLDRGGLLGAPREGWAFGNDVQPRFGPPRFDDAAVQVGEGATASTLRLVYPAGRE